MSTTVVISNLPTNPVDVSVHRFTTGDFKSRPGFIDKDGSYVQEYVFTGGDQTIETAVVYRTLQEAKTGIKRSSVRLRSVQTVTTDSVVTESAPIDVVIGWNTQGPYEDAAAVMKMIGCAFGLTFGTLSSKVPQIEVVGALNRGTLGGLLS